MYYVGSRKPLLLFTYRPDELSTSITYVSGRFIGGSISASVITGMQVLASCEKLLHVK